MHLHISSFPLWPSLVCVCRCQTWLNATAGRRSLSGPLWTPGSWRNAAQRYINHLGETKLLVQHFTINSQIISHLCLFYYCVSAWSKQVRWNCVIKTVSLERLHAVQFHCEPRRAAPAALLQRPAALCAAGREFTAVLPAAHHQQVWLQTCVSVHVESLCVCVHACFMTAGSFLLL